MKHYQLVLAADVCTELSSIDLDLAASGPREPGARVSSNFDRMVIASEEPVLPRRIDSEAKQREHESLCASVVRNLAERHLCGCDRPPRNLVPEAENCSGCAERSHRQRDLGHSWPTRSTLYTGITADLIPSNTPETSNGGCAWMLQASISSIQPSTSCPA